MAVLLYFPFALSLRNIEDFLPEFGFEIGHNRVRSAQCLPKKIITDRLCYYRANLKHFEGMINAQ